MATTTFERSAVCARPGSVAYGRVVLGAAFAVLFFGFGAAYAFAAFSEPLARAQGLPDTTGPVLVALIGAGSVGWPAGARRAGRRGRAAAAAGLLVRWRGGTSGVLAAGHERVGAGGVRAIVRGVLRRLRRPAAAGGGRAVRRPVGRGGQRAALDRQRVQLVPAGRGGGRADRVERLSTSILVLRRQDLPVAD
jgi:hypothetical protein